MGEKTLNEFFYKPAYKAKGVEEMNKFHDALDIADAEIKANKDVRHTQGTDYSNIVICSNYDHPDDAITAIGADNKTLLVTEAETCDLNFTVPANVCVKFERGGKWTINTGITVTFNGQIDAGIFQIFEYITTGTLKFGTGAVEKVYPQWWGAITGDATDDSGAIIKAIASLPITGGTVYLVAGMYRCDNSITFPIDTGYIKNIRIQGESSSLSTGGSTDVNGTKINSYIAGGMLFDLFTSSPVCINVQFRDFECYDMEQTGENYGIKAHTFTTGCIVENVGFKRFTTAIYISSFCYYSKFDRVTSFYARGTGMYIEGANQLLLNRIQCSSGGDIGLQLTATTTHLRGVTVLNSWFEGNANQGLKVLTTGTMKAYSINIIGCYFEGNGETSHEASLDIGGASADYAVFAGTITGNYFSGNDYGYSIRLGYVNGMLVQGNSVALYYNNICIYSTLAVNCQFISNIYSTIATIPLSVPTDNYYIEPSIDKAKLPKITSPLDLTSGQIIFPATAVPSANANTLDDYKEDEWTMGISFGGGTTGITYSKYTGYYTKIGNIVTISGMLALTAKGTSTGVVAITGLPFTVRNNDAGYAASALVFWNITFANQFQGYVAKNTTTILLSEITEAGVNTALTDANFADNSQILVNCTYRIE